MLNSEGLPPHASCACCDTPSSSAPLTESIDEIAFSKSLSGFLIRSPTPAQVRAYIRQHAPSHEVAVRLVNARDPVTGYTALHHATRPHLPQRFDICKLLLDEFAADASAVTPGMRWSCLHRIVAASSPASVRDDIELLRLLVDRGCPPQLVDAQGRTAVALLGVPNGSVDAVLLGGDGQRTRAPADTPPPGCA